MGRGWGGGGVRGSFLDFLKTFLRTIANENEGEGRIEDDLRSSSRCLIVVCLRTTRDSSSRQWP